MARASVAVVGGGIAALTAAWELSGGAHGPSAQTPRIEIFESADDIGGALQTREFCGRTVDCGADGFLTRRLEAVTLIEEVGWKDQLEPIDASGAWLYLRGHLDLLPSGLVLGVPTSASSLSTLKGLTWRAQLAAWRDEHLPRRFEPVGDVTIGAIVRAKLGDELAAQVVEPMIGGIQAGRIDALSATSVFPALLVAAAKGGSLMRAIGSEGPLNPGPAAPTSSGPTFCTLLNGVGSLAQELARQLAERGVIISRSSTVSDLRRTAHHFYRWEVDTATTTTPANAVIVATAPVSAARLLGGYSPALAALATIDSASAAMVTFSVASELVTLPASGTGVLIPLGTSFGASDTMLVTAITLLDRKWPHLRATDDTLIRAHVGRIDDRRHLELSDEQLVARVSAELATILGRWPTPNEAMVVRWPDALPQYRVGHAVMVDAARHAAHAMSVELAGNAYDGVGIPASIGSGRRAARAVLGELGSLELR